MLKVLIVDDEVRVCRLIQYLIDWEALSLHVLGYVNDGLTALTIIKEQSPDIIITDIRMPEYDGLKLIENARSLNSNAHFIIISGYSDFSYAQTAIKYGVDDYILKPIKEKELIQTLEKIIAKIDTKQKNIENTESMRQQLYQREQKVKDKLLNDMLGDTSFRYYSIEYLNQTYFCHFMDGLFQVMGIQIFFRNNAAPQIIGFLNTKVQDTILDVFSSFQEIVFTNRNGILIVLVNGSEETFRALKNDLQKLKSTLLGFKDMFEGIRPLIALSERKTSIEEVQVLIQQVQDTLLNKLFYGFDSILFYKPRPKFTPVGGIINADFRKDFLLSIETLNYEQIAALFENLVETLKNTKPIDGRYILDIYNEIISIFLFGAKNYGIQFDWIEFEESAKEHFIQCCDMNKIFDCLSNNIIQKLKNCQTEKALEHSKPIRQAKQYIKEHFCEPLTLETMGSKVGLNPTYFSSVFKKETNESFIDYLTKVRIQNSKELLVNTNYTLDNIAEMSGFHDIKYFKKKFKKFTGLSPSEYRKLYS